MIKLLKSLTKWKVMKGLGRIVTASLFLILFFISTSSATAQTQGQIFYDNFATSGNWAESNEFDWNTELPSEKQVPSHDSSNKVVHSDDCDSFCQITLLTPLNLSSYGGASISFWRYVDNDLDSGEYLKVEIYNGTSWNQIYYWTYGSGNDDKWHYEQLLLPSQYLVSNFNIRFTTKESSSYEDVEIDDLLIYSGTSLPSPPPGVDIYTGDTATAGLISPGQAVSSEIETSGDEDWFRINLAQGQKVQFDLEGSDTNKGTLLDPYLRGVYNSGGNLISGTTDDDSGTGVNSRVVFTAPSSGNYFVSAGGWGSDTGTYTLTATQIGTPTPSPSPTPSPTPTATPTPTPSPSPTPSPTPSPSPIPSPTPTPTPPPSSGKTQAFFDDFESAAGKWVESNELDWNRELPDERQLPDHSSGNLVAHADNCDNYCVISLTNSLDLSTLSEGTLKFWRYVDNDLDSGEYLKVEIFDGSSWNQIYYWTNGSGDDDTWHYEEYTIPSNYLANNFNIRFTTKESSSYENVEIDDLLIEGSFLPPSTTLQPITGVDTDFVLIEIEPLIVKPKPCPSGTGPDGIAAGDYPPQRLTQEQRQWLWDVFQKGSGQTAPVGYGGERCAESNDDSDQNFFDMVCRRGHVGPGGIVPGDYPPQNLTQEQRQFLFEEFGNQGTAPVGYGGERCLGQDQHTVQDIHIAKVCASGAVGPYGMIPGAYNPQDLNQDERQWLWGIFGEDSNSEAPVGYGGRSCLTQETNFPPPDRTRPYDPNPHSDIEPCNGNSFLHLGKIIYLQTNTPVHEHPRYSSLIVFSLSAREPVTIVSGPSCEEGGTWWTIGTNDGRGGFVNERRLLDYSSSQGNTYYLVPATQVPTLASSDETASFQPIYLMLAESPEYESSAQCLLNKNCSEPFLNYVHSVLNFLGLTPIGSATDALDALIYVAQGDNENAYFSVVAMAPGPGDVVNAARISTEVVHLKAGDNVADLDWKNIGKKAHKILEGDYKKIIGDEVLTEHRVYYNSNSYGLADIIDPINETITEIKPESWLNSDYQIDQAAKQAMTKYQNGEFKDYQINLMFYDQYDELFQPE